MENLVADMFEDIYRNKKVLLTGDTGFKGSWLRLWLTEIGADVKGFSLAPNTSPSHFTLLSYGDQTIIADIRDADAINKVIKEYGPDIVFHLAAQPLVRQSYQKPLETFQTNIIGTVNLFEAVRNSKTVKAVVNITTDKVYKNSDAAKAFSEKDELGGHDPYSTSKACVELVHESYVKSFFKEAGILAATARAGNVIGGGDWAQDRLIPDIVKDAAEEKISDIRYPQSVRPWQHVLDPLSGYLLLGKNLLQKKDFATGTWNFGPSQEDCLPVSEVLNIFNKHWKNIAWNDVSDKKHLHESSFLQLDCTKAATELQWMSTWNIQEAIEKTATWYAAYYQNATLLSKTQLKQYITDAAAKNAAWIM